MIKKFFNGDIELMSLDILAKKLEIHIVTLRRYVREKKLKARKIGRRYYVSRDSLKDFVNGTK
jgi:excisionase family DNA binding protein